MKAKGTFYIKLCVFVIALFAMASLISFGNDALQMIGYFNDTLLPVPSNDHTDKYYDWGIRHYLYIWNSVLGLGVFVVYVCDWTINQLTINKS